jgi:hypothetical protein
MAYSQLQLDALDAAIAQGATSVRFNGRVIEYRSLTEMIKLRDSMRLELGIVQPAAARSRVINITGGKGL